METTNKALQIEESRRDWRIGRGSILSEAARCSVCGIQRAYRHLPNGLYLCELCAESTTPTVDYTKGSIRMAMALYDATFAALTIMAARGWR